MESELWVLFASSFMSATLLPGASEANLIYLVHTSAHSPLILVLIATLGNSLGGITNYIIGIIAAKGIRLRYFEREDLQKSLETLRHYGAFSLLFSWLPIIGDPLCLAAGYLRVHAFWSILFITLGKLLRYSALVFLL